MAFRYVVKKRVFGFDKSKSEKYVAASFSIGEISYDRLCDQVTKEGMAPRGVVKMVMDGLIDALSTYVSLGATVKLGDFGTIRPGLNCKSQSEAKDVTADSIYRQKLILTPGKRLKDMVKSSGTGLAVYGRGTRHQRRSRIFSPKPRHAGYVSGHRT